MHPAPTEPARASPSPRAATCKPPTLPLSAPPFACPRASLRVHQRARSRPHRRPGRSGTGRVLGRRSRSRRQGHRRSFASTSATDGIDLSLAAIVDQDLAHTLVVDFSSCEARSERRPPGVLRGVYRQASAEGIAAIAATGDSGAAACHVPGEASASQHRLRRQCPRFHAMEHRRGRSGLCRSRWFLAHSLVAGESWPIPLMPAAADAARSMPFRHGKRPFSPPAADACCPI